MLNLLKGQIRASRDSKAYRQRKAASDLVNSPAWKEVVEVFLSPDPLPHDPINSIEDALAYNLALGEYRAATTLKALLQALAEEFNQIQVKSS